MVQPWQLKAELKIPETQVKDVQIGQDASIDTRNGIIPGQVMRIDPAAINGTVTVDVKLTGELPPRRAARSERGRDDRDRASGRRGVCWTAGVRPAEQPDTLFRLDADGKGAIRVPVKLGRSSVNTIEIVDGLKVGDQVILSDMSAWDAQNRIRLN